MKFLDIFLIKERKKAGGELDYWFDKIDTTKCPDIGVLSNNIQIGASSLFPVIEKNVNKSQIEQKTE